jgi:hypothetical protein
VRGACTNLHVDGLQQGAALLGPVGLERENDFLKSQHAKWPTTVGKLGCRSIRLQASDFTGRNASGRAEKRAP